MKATNPSNKKNTTPHTNRTTVRPVGKNSDWTKNLEISPNITCPAVMFAQSRKTKVNGRIKVEIISIQNNTNPSPTGEPVGTKWVTNAIFPRRKKITSLTTKNLVLKRIPNHPWLLLAKENGISPPKLITNNKQNSVPTKPEIPEILLLNPNFLSKKTVLFQEEEKTLIKKTGNRVTNPTITKISHLAENCNIILTTTLSKPQLPNYHSA